MVFEVYNSHTGEVYSTYDTEDEALTMAEIIEDELRTEHIPYGDCVETREVNK